MTARRPRPWFRFTTFLRDDAAATAAEFALVIPLFLLIVFGTISGSIMMSAVNQVHYAAERAARCLAVDVSAACPSGTIDAYAKKFYFGPSLTGLTFTTTAPACGKRVVGTGSYDLFSGVGSTSVTITANACYPVI